MALPRTQLPELFSRFGENLPPQPFNDAMLDYLIQENGSESAKEYINATLKTGAAGNLTRIFNNLESADGKTLEEFSIACIKYIKTGNFANFVYMQTYGLVNIFLNDDGTFKPETIERFCKISQLDESEVLLRLYGKKEDYRYPNKVQIIADLIVAACATGIWMIYSRAIEAGMTATASPVLQELATSYKHVTSGFNKDGTLTKAENFQSILRELTFDSLMADIAPEATAINFLCRFEQTMRELLTAFEKKPNSHVEHVAMELTNLVSNFRLILATKNPQDDCDVKANLTALKLSISSYLTQHLVELTNEINQEKATTLEKQKIESLDYEKDMLELFKAQVLGEPSRQQALINSFMIRIDAYEKLAAKVGKQNDEVHDAVAPLIKILNKIRSKVITNPAEFSKQCGELHNKMINIFDKLLSDLPRESKERLVNSLDTEFIAFIKKLKQTSHEETTNLLRQYKSNVNNIVETAKRSWAVLSTPPTIKV